MALSYLYESEYEHPNPEHAKPRTVLCVHETNPGTRKFHFRAWLTGHCLAWLSLADSVENTLYSDVG